MKPILTDIFHIYIIVMMGAFVMLCLLAATGSLDNWSKRYTRNRTGRKAMPNRVR